MLTQPLLDNLTQLGLTGFRTALEAQWQTSQYADLTFEERLGLLVDLECTRRANRLLRRRIKAARFALPATIEDLDLAASRGLPRAQVLELAQAAWVPRHLNVVVLGATGTGKSYLACALGRAGCEAGFAVRYERTSRLLQTLELAHADGSYPQTLRALPASPCSSSMIGSAIRSAELKPRISSKSSMTATGGQPPSSQRKSLYPLGLAGSQTRRWPMPS